MSGVRKQSLQSQAILEDGVGGTQGLHEQRELQNQTVLALNLGVTFYWLRHISWCLWASCVRST